jgi:hypothetical protein
VIFRIDNGLTVTSQEKILRAFFEHGSSLGASELSTHTGLNIDTISPNCKILIKKGVLYDRPNRKGKYRLVESAKLPTFLNFRSRSKTWSMQIMKDLFSSSSTIQREKFEQFANNIGMYILYVLIERTGSEGPWAAYKFKPMIENDPRMKDIDLLRDTWLIDTINPSFLVELFDKYVNNNNQTYQELLQTFESISPDIYNKIVFHEQADKMREVRKNEKKDKKQKPEIFEEDLTNEEIEDRDIEIYDEPENSLQKYWGKRNKDKIESAD